MPGFLRSQKLLITTAGFLVCALTALASDQIMGAYVLPVEEPTHDNAILAFLPDGTYFFAQDGDPAIDSNGQDGIERGTYVWDAETGQLQVTTITNTSGQWGLSDDFAGVSGTAAEVDDTGITLFWPDGESFTLPRVTSLEDNPLVGGWWIEDSDWDAMMGVDGGLVLVFLPNGIYFLAEDQSPIADPNGTPGMERGTYSWDPATGAFSVDVMSDTNGEWGLSHMGENPAILVSEDRMEIIIDPDEGDDETVTLQRIRPGTRPAMLWSAYLGGIDRDVGHAIDADAMGNVWITGETRSEGWTSGGHDTEYNGGTSDAFVARVNADGTLAWSTYLGGESNDVGYAIAVDAEGSVWVTGRTYSNTGFGTLFGEDPGAFVAKYNADGTLAWSSYLGGFADEEGRGIAIDAEGNAWITGLTSSDGWVSGGFDTTLNDENFETSAFVAKITPDGTLAWSTYLGGANRDVGHSIAVDADGNVWVAGETESSGWTTGGFNTTHNGATDGFIARINADGTLAWSSYLGGEDHDWAHGIAVDSEGNAWVTGRTQSPGWASGGFNTDYNGTAPDSSDVFVAKVSGDGSLLWSSYLGGKSWDAGYDIAIDGTGNAWIIGETASPGWTRGGFDNTLNSPHQDAFIAKINADGSHDWSSYIGGEMHEWGFGISLDSGDNAYVTGRTYSDDWTGGAFDSSLNADGDLVGDAFVAKIADSFSRIPEAEEEYVFEQFLIERGWVWSPWFGLFFPDGDWIYHAEHGWLFLTEVRREGFHFFDFALRTWVWTSEEFYPWGYWHGNLNSWGYYLEGGTPGQRYLYTPDSGWIEESEIPVGVLPTASDSPD